MALRYPVAPGTWRLAVIPFLLGALVAGTLPAVSIALFIIGLGVLWFHRDPVRALPATGIVAPADGRVSVIRTEGHRVRIGIFMNLDDVHVTRAPTAGTVLDRTHNPGAHRPAFMKASDRNERVQLTMDTNSGPMEVTLIAGAFARRIHPYVTAGTSVKRGTRLGHISFGSRVDVLLPPAISRDDIQVSTGTPVRAGETILAPS